MTWALDLCPQTAIRNVLDTGFSTLRGIPGQQDVSMVGLYNCLYNSASLDFCQCASVSPSVSVPFRPLSISGSSTQEEMGYGPVATWYPGPN